MTPLERDLAIRTVLSEAGNQGPAGMAAVAHVIRNRVIAGKYGGSTVKEVVTKPYAFEGMDDKNGQFSDTAYTAKPGDKHYEDAGKIVDAVYAGALPDPTNGATHYVARQLQADLGRDQPAWASGAPTAVIGAHSFYAPDGPVGIGTIGGAPRSSAQPAAAAPPASAALGAPPAAANGISLADVSAFLAKSQQPQPQARGLLTREIFGDLAGAPKQTGLLGAVPTINGGQGLLGGIASALKPPAAAQSAPQPQQMAANPVPPQSGQTAQANPLAPLLQLFGAGGGATAA